MSLTKVERNQCEHFLAALLHDLRLFLECAVDFAVHPPTGQRCLGGTEQHLVPKPDALVNSIVEIVAGKQLMLVEPAADALLLKPVMQQTGKCLVFVAVADEAGMKLDRGFNQGMLKASKQPRSKLRGIQKYDFTKPNKAEASFGVSNP